MPLLVIGASTASHSTPEARGWRRGKGKAAGVAGWWQNRSAAAREGKANGAGGSRGGVSEAEALAEAERGAVRAKRGGDAATARGTPSTQAGTRARETTAHPENALAAVRRMSRALARRAARRDARRGNCVRSGGGEGERSEGAGLRLRQRPAGSRPARSCGADPHRRAETGKAGLATWTATGKRSMSVVRNPSRVAPDIRGRMRGACCRLEFETPIRGTPTR